MCFPRFDSDACFAALLGTDEHGCWRIHPEGQVTQVRRRYVEGTLVLETDFETADGVVRLIDLMPPRHEAPDILRMVVGVRGQVDLRMRLGVRFGYGAIHPWIRHRPGELTAIAGPDGLVLHTPVALEVERELVHARFRVSAGERIPFVLTWFPSHKPPPPVLDPEFALKDTEAWWREWSGCCAYEGPYSEQVLRSLPEELGGVRNWDYRYCWLRDATLTLFSLMSAGYESEAKAWRDWLMRAVAGEPAELQIMYGPAGERRLPELELRWLPGYEGSRPVRIGNEAVEQRQLDVYGEVLDCLHQARKLGLSRNDELWEMQRGLLDFLETHWELPDTGIWEVRGPPRHFVHSKVMAWVAFDRAVQAVEQFGLPGPVDRWRALRDRIHAEVCREGYDPALRSFTQSYGSKGLDASLLLIPLVGFLPPEDERVRGTVDAIGRELMKDGFVQRYVPRPEVDGLPPGEGAFLACTFWYVDNLAMQGRVEEARALFERLLSICNDVGLLSEEYDVRAGRLVGNFPQAFSHVPLIDTARTLSSLRSDRCSSDEETEETGAGRGAQ
jgi:GH15 family glucan-1,4-alpha-glucosidase